jgi:hypothetical protein
MAYNCGKSILQQKPNLMSDIYKRKSMQYKHSTAAPPQRQDRQTVQTIVPNFSQIHLSTWSRDPARSRDLALHILHKITQRTCKTIRYVALVVSQHVRISTWSHDLSEIT